MSWFTYLIKTPRAQIKKDKAEYKQLEKVCEVAEKNMKDAWDNLVVEFYEGENFDERHGCIKQQFVFARVNVNGQITEFKLSDVVYASRCKKFSPIGKERLCPHTKCECFNDNQRYFNARKKLEDAEKQYDNFWKNKFQQKIK